MRLLQLTKSMNVRRINGLPVDVSLSENRNAALDLKITSVHYRSTEVRPGGIFFAIKGQQADGHHYIGNAVSNGAAAVVIDDARPVSDIDAVVISVKDTRKALAAASSVFYNNPSEKLFLIGITGTNGKTTTAYLVEHFLQEHNIDVGVISTINYRYHGKVYNNPLTTPESLELQKIIAEMADAGVTHVVMEVSSHGVALDRIYHCWFDMGIYTNLSQDHLDFHKTMKDYWSCKKRFFTDYLTVGPKQNRVVAVINTDNPGGRELVSTMENCRIVSVGLSDSVHVSARHIRFDQYGMSGEIKLADKDVQFKSGLIGRYNLENILCAAGAAVAMSISPASVADNIASFGNVPGRLERISNDCDRHVFLDYAHTPDALENVLSTLKEVIPGGLICVFGCGGDRDKAKRPQMGKIAGRLSDFVVITSDNPRTEDPETIIEAIRNGVEQDLPQEFTLSETENGISAKGYIVEPDREKAIHLGIKISRPNDTILIAGKGHEDYQIIGKKKFPFDDKVKASAALDKLSVKVN
jgi:UDP-N-acetylmuramyl-tripeptide synthetase